MRATLAFAFVLATLASCAFQATPSPTPSPSPTATPQPTPRFDPGTFGYEVRARGKLRVGVMEAHPGFSVKMGSTYRGFEPDIAREVVKGIWGRAANADPDKYIDWVPVVAATRASVLIDGKADIVVATFSPDDTGAGDVDLSAPYLVSGERAMVLASADLATVDDLGGKIVCVERDSETEKNVVAKIPGVRVLSIDSTRSCYDALLRQQTDAVAAQELQLLTLPKTDAKLVSGRISDRPFSIAVRKGRSGSLSLLDAVIASMVSAGTWAGLYRQDITPISNDVKKDPRDAGRPPS